VKKISAPDPLTESLGSRTKMDVRFYEAELEEALRFLAEAGGFAFVAEGEISGRVTTELRGVRPYDALVVIARAYGAGVSRRGKVVVVTPGGR
jgi:type II secretory pathway component HofQ